MMGPSTILWMQGRSEQALHTAQVALDEAQAAGEPVMLCSAPCDRCMSKQPVCRGHGGDGPRDLNAPR